MKESRKPKEVIRILEEDIKEIIPPEAEEVTEEESVEEEFNEEILEDLESPEEYVGDELVSPLLEVESFSEEDTKFKLDDLKDLPKPKDPAKKGKKEELYSTSKKEDFYSNNSSENLYSGVSNSQSSMTSDLYEQSSVSSLYNPDPSDSAFYAISSESDVNDEDNDKDERFEAPSSLEKRFKEDKKDDLMFRS